MDVVLSKEIQAGLDAARLVSLRKASRLRIVRGEEVYPILRMWPSGFSVAAADAPKLGGLVDVYDGAEHLFQCLVVAGEQDGSEMLYDFKRSTAVVDHVPLDFVRPLDAPVALIGHGF